MSERSLRPVWAACLALMLFVATARAATAEPTLDDLKARKAELEKKLDGQGYTILIEPPFVVIGDESAAMVKKRTTGFLRRNIGLLEKDFFSKRPEKIIEVWLFKNEKTYRAGAKKFFNDTPETPYGYYSPEDNALIMNIGPGPGTLSHELVHPYMEANFPNVPSWFNEGLASLYEQPQEKNGHMWGGTNWRLPGLQKAIRDKSLPDLATLLKTSRDGFYTASYDSYAYARFLCQYLQDTGKLRDFYAKFTADSKDPTGITALTEVIGKDLTTFEPQFRKYVMALRR
ncbi:MAG TPA: hypothetical protein VFQ53_25420 [Kofleriaceae bacterium]|nr:hypothetical protein [Kofleriaceae bacterium]